MQAAITPMKKYEFIWHKGTLICSAPNNQGFDIILSKDKWINRPTLRSAKWWASVYRTLHNSIQPRST